MKIPNDHKALQFSIIRCIWGVPNLYLNQPIIQPASCNVRPYISYPTDTMSGLWSSPMLDGAAYCLLHIAWLWRAKPQQRLFFFFSNQAALSTYFIFCGKEFSRHSAGWITCVCAKYRRVLELILYLRPANGRRRYKVTPSLIGWAQT